MYFLIVNLNRVSKAKEGIDKEINLEVEIYEYFFYY